MNKTALIKRGQLYFRCLKPVLSCFNANNLTYALVKGEPLSKLAYNDFGKRYYGDIDILVPRDELALAEHYLIENRFCQKSLTRLERIVGLSGSHQTRPYRMRKGDYYLEIDLNFDLFWGEYVGERIDIKEFLTDTIEMSIYGCIVKTLPPIKALIQLALHHYKEMNSIFHLSQHNCIQYNMFRDVYYLWKNNIETISVEKLYTLCYDYKILPYLYYVFYFTNQIFQDDDLQRYLQVLKTAEGVELLEKYGLSDKERRSWKVDFRTRLESDNLYDLIKNDLNSEDIEKIERGMRIFV